MKIVNITAYPEDESQLETIKAFFKALKIKFEENPYDADFVKKIKQGDEDLAQGKGQKITIDDLNALWK